MESSRRARRRLCVVLAWAVCVLGSACSSQARSFEQSLKDELDRSRAEAGAPGGILAVALGDRPPIVVASGHVDLKGSSPMRPSQAYYLGSVSKTYTAAVVLRLAEEGRLTLDAPLANWLPDVPRADETTIRDLLGHTSGLKDFYSYLYFRPERSEMIELVTREWSETELLELVARFGHWFEPGADWSYSSTNYYLLGVVIERATGLSLPEAYRTYLNDPLGLEDTWLAWHEDARGTLPSGFMGPVAGWDHSEMFGELGSTAVLDRSPVEWGAGGIASTARDAVRFLSAIMRGRLLDEASLAAMTRLRPTPPLGIDAADAPAWGSDGYGLGLVRMTRGGRDLVGHGGLFTGHTAGLWYSADCDATVAVYFNRGFVGQRSVLGAVLDLLDTSSGCSHRGRSP